MDTIIMGFNLYEVVSLALAITVGGTFFVIAFAKRQKGVKTKSKNKKRK